MTFHQPYDEDLGMYDRDRFFDSCEGWVTAWVGSANESQLEAYLREAGSHDKTPMSVFAEDLGRDYDPEYLTAEASQYPCTIRDLADRNGLFDAMLIKEIESRMSTDSAHCFILLWHSKSKDNNRVFMRGAMRCLGSWQHAAPIRY